MGGKHFDSDVEPVSPDFSWPAAPIGGACLFEEASRESDVASQGAGLGPGGGSVPARQKWPYSEWLKLDLSKVDASHNVVWSPARKATVFFPPVSFGSFAPVLNCGEPGVHTVSLTTSYDKPRFSLESDLGTREKQR